MKDINEAFSEHLIKSIQHIDITGKNVDDHLQYHTDTRGDLRYVGLSHLTDLDPHTQYIKNNDIIDLGNY